MNYLIDTQILIWFELSSNELKPDVYNVITDERNGIVVSQISLFEIAIKQRISKLPDLKWPTNTIVNQLIQDGFQLMPIRNTHIAAYNSIPLLAGHRDPFDRLLLATALVEDFTLISADAHFGGYRPQISLLEA